MSDSNARIESKLEVQSYLQNLKYALDNGAKIVSKENKLCMCCMKEHEVKIVRIMDDNIYKGVDIKYPGMSIMLMLLLII